MPRNTTVNPPEPDPRFARAAEDALGSVVDDAPPLFDDGALDAPAEEYARDFGNWVEERRSQLAERWGTLVAQRTGTSRAPIDPLLARFYDLLLRLLPACLGPYRSQFVPLYRNLAELYGSVGAARGLAAGEIIEEVQILRELLIRRLFSEPLRVRRAPIMLREILRLNRMVDRGVTFASVGHTDAMFFALFQGSGAPRQLTEELRHEISEQIDDIDSQTTELLDILGRQ